MNRFFNRSLAICVFVISLCADNAVPAAELPFGLDKLLGKKSDESSAKQPPQLSEVARWKDLPSAAYSLAFSPDASILAIGMKDQIQWAAPTGQTISETTPLKTGQVRSLAYSPDGSRVAAGSYQKLVLIDAKTHQISQTFSGHRGYVNGVAFSPDGQKLVTACDDAIVRVWQLDQTTPIFTLKRNDDPVTAVSWSADGNWIATAAGDDTRPTHPGQVHVWDARTGDHKTQFELHQKSATGVTFSLDGKLLLSSSVDEHVNVYDLEQQKALGFFAGHSRPTNAVVAFPDGATALSISGGRAQGKNELLVWEIKTGEVITGSPAHASKVLSMALSRDGNRIATGGLDQSVAIWNLDFLAKQLTPNPSTNDSATAAVVITQVATLAANQNDKPAAPAAKQLKAGIIGLDTSHVIAFTKTLNATTVVPGAEGVRVVAAYPKGSPDIASSVERVPKYIEEMKQMNVEIVDSIDDLLKKVDVVLLETNDGRPHFDQLLPCLKAHKPTFIDKPVAGTLVDAIAIYEAAKHFNVPVFSSSSLRFGANTLAVRNGSIGKISKAETTSPASLEPTHPDLFWYGIHGVESLFTVMGTGCQSVKRGTKDGKIEVIGQWKDSRTGTYLESGGYTGKAIGDKGEATVGGYDGYNPLVFEIVKFFHTGVSPVSVDETLEIYAFMEAADESKRQNGASVTLESVMAKARPEAAKKVAAIK